MKKAVTLVELIVALVIISIIAALAIPKQSSSIQEGYESAFDAIERNMFNNVDLINIARKKGQSLQFSHSPLSLGYNEFHGLSFNVIKSYDADGREVFSAIEETLPSNIFPLYENFPFPVDDLNTFSHHSVANIIKHQIFLSLSGQDISSNDAGTPSYSNYFLKGLGYAYEINATEEAVVFKTPLQLGKTQREYHYHVLLNTLTRVA